VNVSSFFGSSPYNSIAAAALLLILSAAPSARAQEAQAATTPAQPSEAEAAQRSLARARALAAIGKLAAAAAELEALRAATREESLRDVARVLLVSIYVEMPDYPRASALLEETFKARRPGQVNDAATHAYYALAGQTVNSVRQHLERYRAFGLNVADSDLPAEANGDLEQLRRLLEQVVGHAKAIGAERSGPNAPAPDAMALFEDAATVRMRVARQGEDRAKWQGEVSAARQQLFASETRIASVGSLPGGQGGAGQRAAPSPTPAPASSPAAEAAPASAQPARDARNGGAQNVNTSATAQPPAQPSPETEKAGGQGAQGEPALVAVGSLNGLARQRVTPNYPQIARAARVSGVVTVYLVVNEKGEVASIERAEGPLQLQQAATDAARRWRFNPTVVNGQPVRVSGYLSFNFAL
jgi:TonB family protein